MLLKAETDHWDLMDLIYLVIKAVNEIEKQLESPQVTISSFLVYQEPHGRGRHGDRFKNKHFYNQVTMDYVLE